MIGHLQHSPLIQGGFSPAVLVVGPVYAGQALSDTITQVAGHWTQHQVA